MEYSQIKRDFLTDAVKHGVEEKLPPRLDRWWREFQGVVNPVGTGRLANHFSIGLRMELDLMHGGERVGPTSLGLFGRGGIGTAGNGTRLSVRAKNNRSVVGVLGGMGVGINAANQLGGSLGRTDRVRVRFDRVRGNVEREMTAVERAVEKCCFALGVKFEGFLALGRWNWRLPEGLGVDVWRLFVTLTAMKLAVLHPELWEGRGDRDPRERVRNSLGWWKGLDDDARLAHAMMRVNRGAKLAEGAWAQGWGLEGLVGWKGTARRTWQPMVVEGDKDAREKVEALLCKRAGGRWNLPLPRHLPPGGAWFPCVWHGTPLNLHDLWLLEDVSLGVDAGYKFHWDPARRSLQLPVKMGHLREALLATGVVGVCGETGVRKPLITTRKKSKVLFK